MKKSRLLHVFVITFLLSIFVGGIISIGTYFWTLEDDVNYKIGFPKRYYAQFYIDNTLHHGFDLNNFILDGILIWGGIIFIYLILKRGKRE